MSADSDTRDRGASAGIYNPVTLRLYDLGVLGLTNSLAWRCPTRLLVEHYQAHAGDDHLDIGPGTGYYLERIGSKVTLLDLNAAALAASRERVGDQRVVRTIRQSFFDPLPHDLQYDSIGLNFVLHCIPDDAKWRRLSELRHHLRPGGTLVGSTLIPDRSTANPLARFMHGLYNRIGVFGNDGDTLTKLTEALAGWDDITVTRHGQVVLFSARRPQEDRA